MIRIFILIIVPISCLFCQADNPYRNLVPNPGFENIDRIPSEWYYRGEHFSSALIHWKSPTIASPDLFNPEIAVPENWKNKGFGDMKPYSGSSMIGLTVFGCIHGKPHCREYIQVQLEEPLRVGFPYTITFWVSHMRHSLKVSKIAAALTTESCNFGDDRQLEIIPQMVYPSVLKDCTGKWQKLSFEITADSAYRYLTIGNFSSDLETTFIRGFQNDYKFGYYYFDEVGVARTEPNIHYFDFNKIPLPPVEENKTYALKSVYFDFDSYNLQKRSFKDLKSLLQVIDLNPNYIFEIRGHTDNFGSHEYNQVLSEKRAGSVASYLYEQGIDSSRILTIGFGKNFPAKSNRSPRGRKINRRVEFRAILPK